MTTKVATFSLRLPLSLKAAVEKLAEADGTSMNQFLVMAAAEKLTAMRTAAAFFAERKGHGDRDAAIGFLTRAGGEPPRPAMSWRTRNRGWTEAGTAVGRRIVFRAIGGLDAALSGWRGELAAVADERKKTDGIERDRGRRQRCRANPASEVTDAVGVGGAVSTLRCRGDRQPGRAAEIDGRTESALCRRHAAATPFNPRGSLESRAQGMARAGICLGAIERDFVCHRDQITLDQAS